MSHPRYVTVAVAAALFLFTGIAFGQRPDDYRSQWSLWLNERDRISFSSVGELPRKLQWDYGLMMQDVTYCSWPAASPVATMNRDTQCMRRAA